MIFKNIEFSRSYLSYQGRMGEERYELLNVELVLSASGIEVWMYGTELPDVEQLDLELLKLVLPEHNNMCLDFDLTLGALDHPQEMAAIAYLKSWRWIIDPHEAETLKLDAAALKALSVSAQRSIGSEGRAN